MALAEVRLEPAAARVSGAVDLPALGRADIDGSVSADGGYRLVGEGRLRPAGFEMGQARVQMTPQQAQLSREITLGVGAIAVTGEARPNGQFTLSGEGATCDRLASSSSTRTSRSSQPASRSRAGWTWGRWGTQISPVRWSPPAATASPATLTFGSAIFAWAPR